MDTCSHHISGFCAVRADADKALDALIDRGFPRARVQIFDSRSPKPEPVPKVDSNAALKDVLVDDAHTPDETTIARAVINESVGHHKEISFA